MGSPEILYTQTHKTESVSCTYIFVYKHIYASRYNNQRNRGYEFERERTREGRWDKVWEGLEGGRGKDKRYHSVLIKNIKILKNKKIIFKNIKICKITHLYCIVKNKRKQTGKKRKVLLFPGRKSDGGMCFLSVSLPSSHQLVLRRQKLIRTLLSFHHFLCTTFFYDSDLLANLDGLRTSSLHWKKMLVLIL